MIYVVSVFIRRKTIKNMAMEFKYKKIRKREFWFETFEYMKYNFF
jgi:hypothetical protein